MDQESIDDALQAAAHHHEAGRLKEAEGIYRRILARAPTDPDALHLLGILVFQKGEIEPAIDLMRRAIKVEPDIGVYQNDLGTVMKNIGRFDEAGEYIRKAIELEPDFFQAHFNLGTLLAEKKEFDRAIDAYREAIKHNPEYIEAMINLGIALGEVKQYGQALESLEEAAKINPAQANIYYNIGIILAKKGDLDGAIEAYRKATVLKSGYPEAYYNLGLCLSQKASPDEAIEAYASAIQAKGDYAEAHNNLGAALVGQARLDEALEAYRHAIASRPEYAEAHNNLGAALLSNGDFQQAAEEYRKAIAIRPDYAEPHYNLASVLLLLGDFKEGWKEHEWRWQVKSFVKPRTIDAPLWDGTPPKGKTLFLHAEQGVGDTLQFVRYVPLVTALGAKVILACQPELERLLSPMPGIEQIISKAQALPHFDLHCPLMTLPLALGTTVETIPNQVPYVTADAKITQDWAKKLGPRRGLRVGLAWAGNPAHKNDHNRSMPLAELTPLADVPAVQFFSLQKGPAAARDIAASGDTLELADYSGEFNDFADTAGLIANLDLVIAVDTAVAHLAGAMGKPVWLLVPFSPDWRWLVDREDSPWYPTMRIFRQERIGDWQPAVEKVRKSLEKLAQKQNSK